jgi:hypothetical protein
MLLAASHTPRSEPTHGNARIDQLCVGNEQLCVGNAI